MHKLMEELIDGVALTGDISKDYSKLFSKHNKDSIAEHCRKVSLQAAILAERFGADVEKAVTAGYLHDLGRIFDEEKMVNISLELGLQVLEEERALPGLLHQKLSRRIAEEVFLIADEEILSAVECHSTLKANASQFDMLLLLADKLSWDAEDSKHILSGILDGLEKSLAYGAFSYVEQMQTKAEKPHPWLLEAYEDLCEQFK